MKTHTIYQDRYTGMCTEGDNPLYTENADALIITMRDGPEKPVYRQLRVVRLRGTLRRANYESICPLTFEPITSEDQLIEDAHVFSRRAVQSANGVTSCEGQTWELLGIQTNMVPETANKYADFDAAKI